MKNRAKCYAKMLGIASLLTWTSHANAANYAYSDLGLGAAFAINNSGQIVGRSGSTAALWDRNSTELTLLPSLSGGPAANSIAWNINNVGQIVGQEGEVKTAVIWESPATVKNLSNGLSSQTWATGINDSGEIVGNRDGIFSFASKSR